MNKIFPGKDPYFTINIIFIFLFIILLLYVYFSPFFSIPSNYGLITGENTISTGLTRSFSEILRLNFQKAVEYNRYGMRIFLFFFIQFVMRISVLLFLRKANDQRTILVSDILLSVALYVYCFYPFLVWTIRR